MSQASPHPEHGTIGMVLGKFMPPHLGHLYLTEMASAYVDKLFVVVEHIEGEPIPSSLRYAWMKELLPSAEVLHLTTPHPQDPSEREDFWDLWRTSLLALLPTKPDFVFASEAYGARLAQELHATFIPVDPARSVMPISGTEVRLRPLSNFRFLPPPVRAYYAKRVCIFGPESTGKSTLTEALANHYGSVFVPEYARAHITAHGGRVEAADMLPIARGQLASERALARRCDRVLFSDTDVLATTIWSEVLFGHVDPEVEALAASQHFDLTLLLDVDVPWVEDIVRYLPTERASFFARCEEALAQRGRNTVVVQGTWDERFRTATRAVDALLRS